MERKFKYTKGWIFLDFPANLNLAKEFELKVSGHLSKENRVN